MFLELCPITAWSRVDYRYVRKKPPSLVVRQVRSWNKVDRVTLRQMIVDSPISRAPSSRSSGTTDELFQMNDSTLRRIADQLAPEQTVKCRLRPLCPWFDAECRSPQSSTSGTEEIIISLIVLCRSPPVERRRALNYRSERIRTDSSSSMELWRSLSSLLQQKQENI